MLSAPPLQAADQPEPATAPLDEFEPTAAGVNEGSLRFLPALPEKPVHHHHNEIIIDAGSLSEGWIRLHQCHTHLDPVGRSQIVFHRDRIRDLRITESRGIGESRVENASIQMHDVGRDARLCLTASSRALIYEGNGTYLLRNGPFLRSFLDGYYPMRVTMRVRYEGTPLIFLDSSPPPQKGFEVSVSGTEVLVEARFEGRLVTELRFARR